jgi:LuxR family maltose regulon positive regulatory protein
MMGLSLKAQDIAALEERTEGWIAGLQLAALAMRDRTDLSSFVSAFTGSHRFIVDYLVAEVLARQPAPMQTFLLQTAILERLCGPLCDAVTGQSDSQMTLERLEQANLFIVALDDERKWYRFHHLFAEVLRQGLQRSVSAEAVADLHRRASAWYEQEGLVDEAVDHALAGPDFEQAARLIERVHSAKWRTGETKTLQGWLMALPETAWRSHPRLWLVQAWTAITLGDFSEADEKLRGAEAALALLNEASARSLRPEVLAFRASYASLVRDPSAVELAQQALRELLPDYWLRGMLVVFLAAAHYSMGELNAAAEVLAQGRSTLSTLGAQPHQIHLLTLDGMVHYAKGRLREAWSLLRRALELAEPGGQPIPFVGTQFAYMSASLVLYELDELDQVETYLTRCADQAVQLGSAEAQVFALSGLSRLCLARDDLAAATNYTAQVEALLRAHTLTINVMAFVDYHRFQLLLKQGNLTAAAVWAESQASQSGPLTPYFHRLALPQLRIAQGWFEAALDNLTTLIQEAQDIGQGTVLIKALVLQALAFHLSGNHSQALTALERALTLAAPEGYVRTFVDEGVPMAELLRVAASRGITPNYVSKLLAAFPAEEQRTAEHRAPDGRAAEQTIVSSPQPPSTSAPLLVDPLSQRELELLRLVAAGRTNQEIAEELFLAIGTVKKHLNNIFGKLEVQSRTQAIARARELNLL